MANRHDVVTLASRPAKTFSRCARHPDRRIRLLDGPRVKRKFVETPKLATMPDPLAGPGFQDDVDCFAQPLTIVFSGETENFVVDLGIPRSDAKLKSPAGDGIDHGVVFGAVQRMAQRQNRDARPQANLRCACSRGGEQDGGISNESAITEKMMFIEHEAFPAELFRQFDLSDNLLVIRVIRLIEIREIRRQDVYVKSHARFYLRLG